MSFFRNFIFSAVLSIIFFSGASAQGKIISQSEADKLFGPVIFSAEINSSALMSLTETGSSVLMFKIIEEQLIILDKNRNVLYSGKEINLTDQVEFHVFNNSLVKELLTEGGSLITSVEQREKVLSITNGEITLEFSIICPPFCI